MIATSTREGVGPTTSIGTTQDYCEKYLFGRTVILLEQRILSAFHTRYLNVVKEQLTLWGQDAN